jgi:Holliday junction resolvase RusA-like endonuclease
MIRLRVVGTPATKGSMQVLPRRKFPFLVRTFRDLLSSVIVTSASGHALKAWEKAIREAGHQAAAGRQPFDGAIELTAVFTFLRPKSVSEKKRPECTVKPDLDKLLRGILDPLSGVVYVDDAQIIASHISKRYGDVPGVEITVQPAVAADSLFARRDRAS